MQGFQQEMLCVGHLITSTTRQVSVALCKNNATRYQVRFQKKAVCSDEGRMLQHGLRSWMGAGGSVGGGSDGV